MLRCELLVNESSNILHLIVDHDNRNDMGVNHSYAINFCSHLCKEVTLKNCKLNHRVLLMLSPLLQLHRYAAPTLLKFI